MTDGQPTPPAPQTPDAPLYVGRFVVTAGYPRAAATAFMRFSLSRPLGWIPIAFLLFADIALILTAIISGQSSAEAVLFTVALAFVVVTFFVRANSLARRLSVGAAPGSIYELTLTQTTISVRTPTASSSVLYRYYEKADVRGDFVFLKLRGARIRSIVPRQLFTDDWVAWAKAQIEARP